MKVRFTLPWLIIDAETNDPLEQLLSSITFKVIPQMTEEMKEYTVSIADAMSTAVVGLSILQIVLLCLLGKTANKLWIMVGVL